MVDNNTQTENFQIIGPRFHLEVLSIKRNLPAAKVLQAFTKVEKLA